MEENRNIEINTEQVSQKAADTAPEEMPGQVSEKAAADTAPKTSGETASPISGEASDNEPEKAAGFADAGGPAGNKDRTEEKASAPDSGETSGGVSQVKQPVPFVLTRRAVIAMAMLIILAIVAPSSIYLYEMHSLRRDQQELKESLQESVRYDVGMYISALQASSGIATGNIAASGYVVKGGDEPSVSVADEVAAVLTDEYIGDIKDDMLDELYKKIDDVVAQRYLELEDTVKGEIDTKTSEIAEGIAEDIAAKEAEKQPEMEQKKEPEPAGDEKKDVQPAEIVIDAEMVSQAVSAIVTQDLKQYKQEMLNKVAGLDNFYADVNTSLGTTGSTVSGLEKDVSLLSSTYDQRFKSLEAADRELRSQVDYIKSQNSNLQRQYNELSQRMLQQGAPDFSKVQNEMQKRIDSLRSSSEENDVALSNMLAKAQKDLSSYAGAEDAKIYDNALRIIELSDTISGMNTDLSGSIERLASSSQENTAELYLALKTLENQLSFTDSSVSLVSEDLAQEAALRKADVKGLLDLIDQYRSDSSADSGELLDTINNKAEELSRSIAEASAAAGGDIDEVNDRIKQLEAGLDEKTQALAKSLEDESVSTDSSLSELYEQLKALDAGLKENNADTSSVSEDLSAEASQRKEDVAALIALIEEYRAVSDSGEDALLETINTKAGELSLALSITSAALQDEYNHLISDLSGAVDKNSEDVALAMAQLREQLQGEIRYTDQILSDSIDETNTYIGIVDSTLRNSISETDERLTSNLKDQNEKLTSSIDNQNERLTKSIRETDEKLSKSISDTNDELRLYIDDTNLETKEQLLAVIAALQDELDALQEQVDTLQAEKDADVLNLQQQVDTTNATKLNIVDSTNYSLTTSGDTVHVKVPSTNPNYSTAD